MELRRFKIEPAPAPVPPAPLPGERFAFSDGRTFILPPPTLAQIHGQCAESFATIINVIAADQWGIATAVQHLVRHAYFLVYAAMSRNYDIELHCKGALGECDAAGTVLPLCNACVACLLDMQSAKPILTWLTEVSGYQELLRLVGHRPATASLDSDGASSTTNA